MFFATFVLFYMCGWSLQVVR